jgi:hypothetical protein
LAELPTGAKELVVVSPRRKWKCSVCHSKGGGFLAMEGSRPVCLVCADMGHLMFLPLGDDALTRRAMANSGLSAVVVRFSRQRRHFEREGVLVEKEALELAEAECLPDEEVRARRRERAAQHVGSAELELRDLVAEEIARQFPACPPGRARAISDQIAALGSARVGGSAAAGPALEPEAITVAVATSVRHADTPYDELLMSGIDRIEARARVQEQVTRVLDGWRGS